MTRAIRAWWAHRQGLDGTLAGATPAQVLQRSGWARSVGGVGPYLTLFARAGLSRAAVDAAVAAVEMCELPSARGCTYVVPAADYALALTVGEGFDTEMRVAEKLGVTAKEIAVLCDRVEDAVSRDALDPRALRDVVGDAARNLGPEGAKKGVTSTLPLALGRLQAQGRIRRVPTNGRLDQQRYKYARWSPGPLAATAMSRAEAFTALARRFFGWIGPATLASFQWFSGLSATSARAAVDPLGLVPVEPGSSLLLHAADAEALRAFRAPTSPRVALVSSLDALLALRRDVASLLDPADHDRPALGDKGRRSAGGLQDVPSHAIVDRGRLVGLWEYDPESRRIVASTFGVSAGALDAEVARTETFVRDELGDARAFSLDSPRSRGPRIEALRAAR